ncbi:MAG: hypothetical protein ACXV96_02250 [Candidatus Angelobacter sp.]
MEEILKLHYANAEDLGKNLNLTAIRGRGVVQCWLKPGDSAVELSFSGDTWKTANPYLLEALF